MVTKIVPVSEAHSGTLDNIVQDVKQAFRYQDRDVYSVTLTIPLTKRFATTLREQGWTITTCIDEDDGTGNLHIWCDTPGLADAVIHRINEAVKTATRNYVKIDQVPNWAVDAIIDGLWDAGYQASRNFDDPYTPGITIDWSKGSDDEW